eukprot:scaffold29.g5936.t1
MRRQLARVGAQLGRSLLARDLAPSASGAAEPLACPPRVQAAAGWGQPAVSTSYAAGGAARRGLAQQTAGRPAPPGEGVQLSDTAVQRLRELQSGADEPVVLRLTVEGGGCSGFQYEFSIDSAAREGDRVFDRDGATVVMDDVSFEFLKGAVVDWESDLMRSAFVVQSNPNAASSCGCGSSFVAK